MALHATSYFFLRYALAGNVDAARALLDRCLGKPRGVGLDIEDPAKVGTIDLAVAAAQAAARGDMDPKDAQAITQTVRDVEELRVLKALEDRVAALEKERP